MTATAQATKTIQIYRVYIKATPQAIWDAILSGLKTLLETGVPLPFQSGPQ